MKFKRLVPLALALAIASTTAAEAARLPQNRFSFAVRPGYTQTVSRPSTSTPSQSTECGLFLRLCGEKLCPVHGSVHDRTADADDLQCKCYFTRAAARII